ncbi:MAG: biotin--[acetyl-CoA-carboxylase] ligase [Planctomycetaceae bacterium]
MPRRDCGPFDGSRLLRETSLQHIEYHARLESTNTLALSLLNSLLNSAPALVITPQQTAGRGRKGNRWWSAGGALTFSLVLRSSEVPLAAERRSLVAIATGLAVQTVLSEIATGIEFQLKWPNDVLSGGRKICGILVEQSGFGEQQGIIVGVGVNVSNSLRDAPSAIASLATSLCDLTNSDHDLTDVLTLLLNQIDQRISQFAMQPRLALAEANRVSLLNGRLVRIRNESETVEGECLGIDSDGCLVISSANGPVTCSSGVVERW